MLFVIVKVVNKIMYIIYIFGRNRLVALGLWMKTVLNDLESYNLTLTEAVNVAQNHLYHHHHHHHVLWRLLVVSGIMHKMMIMMYIYHKLWDKLQKNII